MEPEVLGSRPRGGTISPPPFDADELAAIRAATPMCARLAHFNHAGMSLTPQPVLNTVMAHLAREQRMGGYRAESDQAERLSEGYDLLARLLGAKRSEVAFMHNATRAWEVAVAALGLGEGDRVIAHESEYVANRLSLNLLRRRGMVIDEVGSRPDGCMDPQAVADALRNDTKLVCATHVPSTHGRINPVADIGRVARGAGVPFILDACQSAGQLALDVEAIGCDIAVGTGRKFLRGPRGTGWLYVREAMLERMVPQFPDYRSARFDGRDGVCFVEGAIRFETYEHAVAAKLGFIRALEYALELGPERIEATVRQNGKRLRGALMEAGVEVLPDQTSGIVVFDHPGRKPEKVRAALAGQKVNVSVSAREFQTPERALRASVHYLNTEEEIGRLVEML